MRIHSLQIQAFGPFAGREVVDFDALGLHGLFLLNGPTGAGKTSVLDAVCYAFYGSVPGARQEGRRLRSDHALPGVPPEVVCEFSARGRRFTVIRSPQWSRPAKRGGGTTTEQAHTLLSEWIDGAWVEKSTRNDEAAAEISALLGMNREQFTRVVMLPQGDFAAFLRSDAKSRRDLLQQLFNTDRFERIEQRLAEEAAAARAAWEDRKSELERIHRQAVDVWAAHVPPEDEAPVSPDHEAPVALSIDAMLAQIRESAETALQAAVHQRAHYERVRLTAFEAQARHNRREALRELHRREAAWESGQPEAEEIAESLLLHRRAEVLSSSVRHTEELRRVAADREQAAADQGSQLQQHHLWLGSGSTEEDLSEDALIGQAREAGSILGAIAAGLPDERKLQTRLTERRTLLQSVADGQRQDSDLCKSLEESRNKKQELGLSQSRLEPIAERLGEFEEIFEACVRQRDAVTAHTERKRRAADIEAELLAARNSALDRKAECLDLTRRRLDQAAAELANGLQENHPCPVCGSEVHPLPAAAGDDGLVSRADEDEARQAQERAEADVQSVAARLATVREEIAGLAAQGGNQPEDEVAAAVASAEQSVESSRSSATELVDLRALISELDQRVQRDEARSAELKDSIARSMLRLEHVDADISDLESQLRELRAGYSTVDERRTAVAEYRGMLDAVLDAVHTARTAEEARGNAESHLAAELQEAGFVGVEAVKRALLDVSTVRTFESRKASRLRERVEIDALRESEQIQLALSHEVQGEPVMTPEDLQQLHEDALREEELHTQARVRAGILAGAVDQVAGYATAYVQANGDAAPLREQWELMGQLADTARGSGDNAYRMTLSTYVLAARLEQIALTATERLAQMTDGRYALVHSDAKSGNRKSGLALQVTDEWTGQARDTSTLSGGESFMASLALALGLADVVQQESGGVEMETLFVDEGFGSLDEESLEQVMDALEGLRDSGRIVGLVSHVGEMKQRIPTQLEVVKERTGSTIRLREMRL